MANLTHLERELVALGAALASNCLPCIQHHIPEARKAGLTDDQITEAVRLADQVRQTPARLVLEAATKVLGSEAPAAAAPATCCGSGTTGQGCCA